MPAKKLIGITGGIGSGKTTVCRAIASRGYPVFYSDTQAKQLVEQDPQVRDRIISLLGMETYDVHGYNKEYVASRVFADKALLSELESIIHPAVRQAFADFASAQSSNLVFNEAAILFEKGAYKQMDLNVLVMADRETRIRRVMARDGVTRELVLQRMKNQWPDDEKEKLSDFIIDNNDGADIDGQLDELFRKLDANT